MTGEKTFYEAVKIELGILAHFTPRFAGLKHFHSCMVEPIMPIVEKIIKSKG